MRRTATSILPLLVLALNGWTAGAATNTLPIFGFSAERAIKEHALEAQFDAGVSKENQRSWMQTITQRPHHLGSPYGAEMAEFMAAKFRSWGYETEIEQFEVLFPTPKVRVLELTSPSQFTAKLEEPALPEDATSGLKAEQLPVYHAYSVDGDVTGELVYVNYGVPKDYEILAERGVDVKGKIVLARYGGSWRGIKPKVAAEHGAIGCLVYSDPKDDGYAQGDTYPKGAWRNEAGAQRGSVADIPLFPGDPLTPGVGATKDAKRLSLKEAPTLTKIPVMPISYGDALPLLRALAGSVAPDEWRGALPITYHIGPGPATVHLKLEFDWKTVPARDVIARLPGSERPEEWIVRGNHHDAWVFGAEDPISGAVALLEEARGISELVKAGWRPKRTIVFALWDGEEPGLLGSTEWTETHATLLKQKAAVYLNTDGNGRGFLSAGGSQTLERFVNEIARDVTDPERNVSVAERLKASRLAHGNAAERKEVRSRAGFRVEALGSGSDFSPFLQHLGIASLNLGYGGEGGGGSYHSIYDSFSHFSRFIDPGYEYGVVLTKTAGRAVMRLADADVLPFEFTGFTEAIETYVKEVIALADELREETREQHRLLADKTLELAADPQKPFFAPARKTEVPFLNFAPLQNALAKLQGSSTEFTREVREMKAEGRELPQTKQVELDAAFMKMESLLTRPEGLPRRSWYQHFIYAPGFYTGYGVKTLPGVREALEQRDWEEVARQITAVSQVLNQYAEEIDRARLILKQSNH